MTSRVRVVELFARSLQFQVSADGDRRAVQRRDCRGHGLDRTVAAGDAVSESAPVRGAVGSRLAQPSWL